MNFYRSLPTTNSCISNWRNAPQRGSEPTYCSMLQWRAASDLPPPVALVARWWRCWPRTSVQQVGEVIAETWGRAWTRPEPGRVIADGDSPLRGVSPQIGGALEMKGVTRRTMWSSRKTSGLVRSAVSDRSSRTLEPSRRGRMPAIKSSRRDR